MVKTADAAGGMFQYFIKIVPTIYSDISSSVHSYQVRLLALDPPPDKPLY